MDRIEMEICYSSNGAIAATISALSSTGNAKKIPNVQMQVLITSTRRSV
jgi:hypothetical protein